MRKDINDKQKLLLVFRAFHLYGMFNRNLVCCWINTLWMFGGFSEWLYAYINFN